MVQQKDIQEAIQLSIHLSRPATSSLPHNGYINVAHTAVGLASAGSASKSPLQHDIRMALCKKSDVIEEDGLDPATESMRCILRDVRHNPQILYQENTLRDISMALGRVIYNMLQLPPDDIDISKDFTSLGVDSLHGVELRDQLRRVMLLDISLIDIKTSGSIEGLGKLILEKLKVNYRLTE
jgi:acyl carrier protein